MTATTITERQVRDLLIVMDGANRIVTRILSQIEGGEISPEQAAKKINEAVEAIKEAAK